MAYQIILSGRAQLALLGGCYRLAGRAKPVIFPQLDLHKGQKGFVFRHKVKLTHSAAEIAGRNGPAVAPKLFRHLFFPPLPQQAGIPSPAHSFFKNERRWMGQGPNFRSSS